jgi:sigma-B regulation protein RsbU (phosphoserine phosphatase)
VSYMMSRATFLKKTSVRRKILIIFLLFSIASLVVVGMAALMAITNVGTFASRSSITLGQDAVSDSSAALQSSAEGKLIRIAMDQAELTNVVFSDIEGEITILEAHAHHHIDENLSLYHAFPLDRPWEQPRLLEPRPDIIIPGAQITRDSEEFYRLSGMDDLLRSVKNVDPDVASMYIATDSGAMWIRPGFDVVPDTYDPRKRSWYTAAKDSEGFVWSLPYWDAAGNGLIITCSKAIRSKKYGTWVVAADVKIDTINNNILNMTLGGQGYAVLLDSNSTVISRPGLTAPGISWDQKTTFDNALFSMEPGLARVAINMTAQKTGVEKIAFNGTDTYIAYAPVKSMNWSYAVSMPVSEIIGPVQKTRDLIDQATQNTTAHISEETDMFKKVFAGLFCLLLAVVVLLSFFLARFISRPVEALKDGTAAIGTGNLDYRVSIDTGDEFEELAHSFNSMAADLKNSIADLRRTTADKERYAKEMEIAREIQKGLLPESIPKIPGLEIAAAAVPTMEIGGDLYDFIPVDGHRWGVIVADVSGKGVSAALFMALSRTMIRASSVSEADPSTAILLANRNICEDAKTGMFITAFYGVIDTEGMTISYVNSGHNPPLLIGSGSEPVRFLDGKGIALGVLPDAEYPSSTVRLEKGDLLVMYTDGVTEALNERDELYGESRLIGLVRSIRDRPLNEIVDRLIVEVRAHAGSAPQSDDITLVLIRRT